MKKLLLLLVLISFLSTPAHALGIRDQGQIFGTGGILTLGTDQWSQSITTGIAGYLTEIEFQIDGGIPASSPSLSLAVYSGGNPTSGSALFSQSLTPAVADLDADRLFIWDLNSANLLFDVGDVFTFAFRASGDGFIFAGNDGPGYVGGSLYKNGAAATNPPDVRDIGFRTYVTSVPEPASMLLLGTGLIGIAGLRRKKFLKK